MRSPAWIMSDTVSGATSGRDETLRQRADALIRACLRGEPAAWPESGDAGLGAAVLERCAIHGVAGLLYRRLEKSGGWTSEVLEALRQRHAAAAIWESQHQRYLATLLRELAGRGIEPVLLKGTALAYTCYADAALRVRGDTDLLIPSGDRDEVVGLLGEQGFRVEMPLSGDFVSHQAPCIARDQLGLVHTIDLHWRISNGQVLSRLFSHAELRARAVPAPRLCREALVTSRTDAILIACMHRRTHSFAPYWVDGFVHFSPDRLIWLYDLHLLAHGLTSEEQRVLVRRAHEKGLAGLCHDELAHVAEVLGTPLPSGLLEALDPGDRREIPRTYLDAGPVGREVLNFKATEGLGPKLRLLRERIFPPGAYMRQRFAEVRPSWLPWLYVRRAAMGAAGWLTNRRDRRTGGPGA